MTLLESNLIGFHIFLHGIGDKVYNSRDSQNSGTITGRLASVGPFLLNICLNLLSSRSLLESNPIRGCLVRRIQRNLMELE